MSRQAARRSIRADRERQPLGPGSRNGEGGDLENYAEITNSVVSRNDGATGGGILNAGVDDLTRATLTIKRSVISENRAQGGPGGIANRAFAIIADSTISDNSAQDGDGGGLSDACPATDQRGVVRTGRCGAEC